MALSRTTKIVFVLFIIYILCIAIGHKLFHPYLERPEVIIAVSALWPLLLIFLAFENEKLAKSGKLLGLNDPIGKEGAVLDTSDHNSKIWKGQIKVLGVIWNAECQEGKLEKGDNVIVLDRQGLILYVSKNT